MKKQKERQEVEANVVSPVGRISYPHLFEKQVLIAPDGQTTERYCVDLIFDKKSDLKELKELVDRLVRSKFGDAFVGEPEIKVPFKNGNKNIDKATGEVKNGYKDTIYISFTSKTTKPIVKNAKADRLIEDPEEVYGGCYGRVLFNASTYDYMNKGVKFYLSAVQKVRDGEPFGSTKLDPDACFDAIESDNESDNEALLG